MSLHCRCSRFSKDHYPIRRNGPNGTSGLAVIFAPNNVVKEDIRNMELFFQEINLRVRTITDINSFDQLEAFLNKFAQRRARDIKISGDDSIFVFSIISPGDRSSTILPDGHIISDVDVLRYFSESCCPILRDKPKLNFNHKYWLDLDPKRAKILLTPGFRPSAIANLEWTTTSSNILSFYSFDFVTPLTRTDTPFSPILSQLPIAYQKFGKDKDVVSFLTEFMEHSDLINKNDLHSRKFPPPSTIAKDLLRSQVYFISPLQALEEQEDELNNSLQTISISPQSSHFISPHSSHFTSPQSSNFISPQSSHFDSPKSSHFNSPQSSHFTSPQSSHFNSPQSSHFTSPQSSHFISPQSPHSISPHKPKRSSLSFSREERKRRKYLKRRKKFHFRIFGYRSSPVYLEHHASSP